MRVVSFDDIIFDDRSELLCKYGCKNYLRKYCCPPDSLVLKKLIQKKKFKWVLLAATTFPLPDGTSPYRKLCYNRQKEHEIQKISTSLHDFFNIIGVDHVVLSGGACKKCQICSKTKGLNCKKPGQKLTSMEAVGIDCQKTMTNAGFPFEMPSLNSINRCTAILFDSDDFSNIFWKKTDSNQKFPLITDEQILETCKNLRNQNRKMISEVRILSVSDLNTTTSLCDSCSFPRVNYACPPYSEKIDIAKWDRAILWRWYKNSSKSQSYNNALKLVHTTFFKLGFYYAFSIRDCYCDECSVCEFDNPGSTCKYKRLLAPSMQSQGIDPIQFGNGKYGLELI